MLAGWRSNRSHPARRSIAAAASAAVGRETGPCLRGDLGRSRKPARGPVRPGPVQDAARQHCQLADRRPIPLDKGHRDQALRAPRRRVVRRGGARWRPDGLSRSGAVVDLPGPRALHRRRRPGRFRGRSPEARHPRRRRSPDSALGVARRQRARFAPPPAPPIGTSRPLRGTVLDEPKAPSPMVGMPNAGNTGNVFAAETRQRIGLSSRWPRPCPRSKGHARHTVFFAATAHPMPISPSVKPLPRTVRRRM